MSGSLLLKRPFETPGAGPDVSVRPDGTAWQHLDFDAYHVAAGSALTADTHTRETALVVLGGTCTVEAGGQTFAGVGQRRDLWARTAPSVVLLPPGTPYAVRAATPLHLAVVGAASSARYQPRLVPGSEMLVEQRGEGNTLRQIHHVLPPSAEADRLILFEVYTPAGNWSSFPPHKHDTEDPPRERALEELYYYGVNPPTGFALQRIYTADGSLDESLAPHDGDLVLVPRGYHVVAATPGHECYYLNAMAGPTRDWRFTVDPDYAALMTWQPPTSRP